MTIDWARIPADQIDAIKGAIDRGEEESEAEQLAPTTAVEAMRVWLEDNRRGGYLYWEQMEKALLVLAQWVDEASLPAAEASAATDPNADVPEPVVHPTE